MATTQADPRIALIEGPAANADEALEVAWKSSRSQGDLSLSQLRVPQHGWDERHYYEYASPDGSDRLIHVFAWHAGTAWTVSILTASPAAYQKHEAELSALMGSLVPKGYRRENFAGRKPHRLDAGRIAKLRQFVESGMRELAIPGVAVALLDHGKVVFLQGLGVRALGATAQVDADTLFMAASNTKALTTLLLATLVDEHKLEWEEPVTQALRSFKLGDATTTQQVRIKHLVCACTGLPQQNLEWLFNSDQASPDAALALLATAQPTTGFGDAYQYSNLMAAAAGYVAAHSIRPEGEPGLAYDQAMRERVFVPLGMDRTTFDFAQALRENFASPHGEDIGGRNALASVDINRAVLSVRPAGGMWTSARDLSRYVQMELAEGRLPNGMRLVSRKNLDARRLPQIATSANEEYGMGLVINRAYGIRIIDHGGSQFGYKSDMYILPAQGVGAVLLTNADSGMELTHLFLRRLLEVLYDAQPEAQASLAVVAANRRDAVARDHRGLSLPADPQAVAELAVHYVSAELGQLRIRREAAGVIFDFGTWHSQVASRKNTDGTISLVTVDPSVDGFDFKLGTRDGQATLTIHDAQHAYLYVAREEAASMQ